MKKIEGYHIWKIYNVYSHDDDLAIFETSNVPELEDPFSFSGYGEDNFKCNLHVCLTTLLILLVQLTIHIMF